MDAQGNVDVADADVTVTVDTVPADLIGAITIPEDLNGDGILNADELGTDGSFNAQVALGPDAVDGTVVNVNGTNYTVTAADLTNGYITAASCDRRRLIMQKQWMRKVTLMLLTQM